MFDLDIKHRVALAAARLGDPDVASLPPAVPRAVERRPDRQEHFVLVEISHSTGHGGHLDLATGEREEFLVLRGVVRHEVGALIRILVAVSALQVGVRGFPDAEAIRPSMLFHLRGKARGVGGHGVAVEG
jgi:hypothetical protein